MLLKIPVQKFFEEAFVRERGDVVDGPNLVKNRQRDSPRHPLPWQVGQFPPATKKRFNYLYLRLGQTAQTRGEVYGFE